MRLALMRLILIPAFIQKKNWTAELSRRIYSLGKGRTDFRQPISMRSHNSKSTGIFVQDSSDVLFNNYQPLLSTGLKAKTGTLHFLYP
jgi:hypothetical protein